MKFIFNLAFVISCLSFAMKAAFAAEVSVVSGVYKDNITKNSGGRIWKETAFGVGGRYSEPLTERYHWYGEGGITIRSYDGPSNSVSLSIGSGLRLYLDPLTDSIAPYLSAGGEFKNEITAEGVKDIYTESDLNGLFYDARVGLRINLDRDFFLDLEAVLFNSALYGVTKQEVTVVTAGVSTTTKGEVSRTELFMDSDAQFSDIKIIIGMKI